MEVAAPCIQLLINMWLLLVTQVQDTYCASNADAAFLHVVPNSLQHFEYESVSFTCEGFDGELGWRVRRRIRSGNSTCESNWGVSEGSVCTITNVYAEDGGEYWCETGDGKKSNDVNITVTAGSVILESPVLPAREGDAVTLRCRNKTTSSNISASYYKNSRRIQNVSGGNMIIRSVSRSDEGLYKCSISGAGDSAESRLTVRGHQKDTINICSDQLPVLLYFLIRTISTVSCAALLLLLLTQRDSGKHRAD